MANILHVYVLKTSSFMYGMDRILLQAREWISATQEGLSHKATVDQHQCPPSHSRSALTTLKCIKAGGGRGFGKGIKTCRKMWKRNEVTEDVHPTLVDLCWLTAAGIQPVFAKSRQINGLNFACLLLCIQQWAHVYDSCAFFLILPKLPGIQAIGMNTLSSSGSSVSFCVCIPSVLRTDPTETA